MGKLNNNAEAVCQLLGYSGADPYRDDPLSDLLHEIEIAWKHKEKDTAFHFHPRDNFLEEIPEVLFEETWIEELHISGNSINHLPEKIGNLTKLKILSLEENSLKSLPESVGRLHNLEVLELNNNLLTHLPESICQLSKLENLEVENNRLVEIPEKIGQPVNLRGNELTCLPTSIGQLSMLEELILYDTPVANRLIPWEVMAIYADPEKFLPKVLDRLTQPDDTHHTLDEESATGGSNSTELPCEKDNKSDSLPPYYF
jgi:hypothetical protein